MTNGLLITLFLAGLTIAILLSSRRRGASLIAHLLEKGHSDFSLGRLAEARLCYEKALQRILREDASEDDREWLATAHNGLGYVEWEDGRVDVARQAFLASRETCEEQHAIIRVSSQAMLIRIAAETDTHSPEVESLIEDLRARLEELSSDQALEAAHFLSHFAEPLLNDELSSLIEKLTEMTVRIVDRVPSGSAPAEMVLDILNIAAWCEVLACRWKRADELTSRAIALTEEGVSELSQTIYSLQLASSVDLQLGRLQSAEEKARRAVTGAEVAPATPWIVAQARSQLAEVLAARGEPEEALALQRSAAELTVRFHNNPQSTFRELTLEASFLRDLSRYDEAFEKLSECQLIHRQTPVPSWVFGYFLTVRGLCLFNCRQFEAARDDFIESAAISASLYGEGHEWFLRSRLLAFSVEHETGQLDLATTRDIVASILQQETGVDLRSDALILMAMIECDLGLPESAEARAREAVDLSAGRCGGRTQTASLAGQTLGRILIERGQLDDAENCLVDTLRRRESVSGGNQCPCTARILDTLSQVASLRGRTSEAESLRARATEIRSSLTQIAKKYAAE